jgi:hypothetical protein
VTGFAWWLGGVAAGTLLVMQAQVLAARRRRKHVMLYRLRTREPLAECQHCGHVMYTGSRHPTCNTCRLFLEFEVRNARG